jgi:ABC-type Mn2+/Zn2+ transport system permease subunit
VIESFLDSWALFHNAYLTGWLMGIVLSLVGVLVVAKDQIFIGAAVSQCSMLGITAGIWLSDHGFVETHSFSGSDAFYTATGTLFAVLGAALSAAPGGKWRESREAVTGWLFLLGISGSILVAAASPHGLEQVHRLIASTIIGATAIDVGFFAAMAIATAIVLARWNREILLVVIDPEMAEAVGAGVARWNALLWVWIGIAVSLAIRVSGITYTFACLVLPALIAKNVCRTARQMFWVAPAVALLSGIAGFVLANHHDYPPGQTVAALQCALLALSWAWRTVRAHLTADS